MISSRTLLILLFVFVLILGIVIIIIIAQKENHDRLPDKIDVVIFENSRGRHELQILAVQKHMTFINHIHVLHPTRNDKGEMVSYHEFHGNIDTAFDEIPNLTNISGHAMFLSDNIFPLQKIKKTYLYHGDRSRIFNLFMEQSEVNFFEEYLETVLATFVVDVASIKETDTYKQFIFKISTEKSVVLRNDMSRDILINSEMPTNAEVQFKLLLSKKPLFATFHVSGNIEKANQKLINLLKTEF